MKSKTYKLILIPILAALSFVGTYIRIPLPTGGMIHLGNFIVIIGSFLIGGLYGGIAGGIGCGMFDLIIFSDPIGMIAYFILKLIMGLIAGLVFKLLSKSKIQLTLKVILSTTCAIFANMICETIYKLIRYLTLESLALEPAFIKALSAIPACLFTGIITIVVLSLVYPLVYNGVKTLIKEREASKDE